MRAYKCSRCGEEVKTKRTFGSKTAKFKCKNGHHFLVDKDTPYEMKVVLPSAINCPHTDRRSRGLGMCGTCYHRHKIATDPEYKMKVQSYTKNYIEKNQDRIWLTRSRYAAKKLPLEAKKKLLNWLFALIQEEKAK